MEINRNKKVYLKALKKSSWSGFHRFPKCKDSVIASEGRNGYNTGLTNEEAKMLEKELRLKEGELSAFSSYWNDFVINIYDKPLTLDLSNPKDYLDYKLLLVSKKVANSEEELDKFPKAKYVIVDEEFKAKKTNLKVKAKKDAWRKFAKMTISEMKQILKLMGKYSDDASDTVVENTLEDIVENKPDKFNEIVNVDHFKERLLIEDLLHANVIRKSGTKYLYGDDAIGHTLEEAIDYLVDPKNQEVLIIFKNKLESLKD